MSKPVVKPCPTCKGTGVDRGRWCRTCSGQGFIEEKP